jgi:hypothetical protein
MLTKGVCKAKQSTDVQILKWYYQFTWCYKCVYRRQGKEGYESRSPLVGSTCPMGATLRPPFKGYHSHRRLRTVTDKIILSN